VGRTRTIKGKGVPEIEDKNGWPGNSLGQWSVELGKALAQRIAPGNYSAASGRVTGVAS